MKVELNATAVLALVGVAGVGLLVWKGPALLKKAGAAVADAANAVNPLNHDNVFAQTADAVTSEITGQPDTLGGAVRSATSNDDERIRAMLEGRPIPEQWSLFSPSTWFN